jgi:hypothetical protein
MTNFEKAKRINQAIAETDRVLTKARMYSKQAQDKKLINFHEAHLTKLENMLLELAA